MSAASYLLLQEYTPSGHYGILTGPRSRSLGASFVLADWQVRVFWLSCLVYRTADHMCVCTIPLYGCMYRRSNYTVLCLWVTSTHGIICFPQRCTFSSDWKKTIHSEWIRCMVMNLFTHHWDLMQSVAIVISKPSSRPNIKLLIHQKGISFQIGRYIQWSPGLTTSALWFGYLSWYFRLMRWLWGSKADTKIRNG